MDIEKKKKYIITAISLAVLFVVLYFITNIGAITGFLSEVFKVITPIAIGGAIAYLLNPILKLFEYKVFKKMKNKNLCRALSLLLTYIVAILIILSIILLMLPQLIESAMDFTSKFDSYIDHITEIVNNIIVKLSSNPDMAEYIDSEGLLSFVTSFLVNSGTLLDMVAEYAKSFALGLFVGVKNAFLGFFISIYILISKERLNAQARRLSSAVFKETVHKRIFRYFRIAHRTFGGFFIGKILDSAIIGLITFVSMIIFSVPYAPLVSAIVGITNIIPVFGPFIGAIPSAFIIFIAEPKKALVFLILILIIQQLDGNVIGPKILGNSTGISSLGVVIAIVVMGEWFGVIGMIIGVPLFALIIIISNDFIARRLRKKGLPESTDEYYPSYSLVDPHEHHEKIGEHIFNMFRSVFNNISKLIKKIINIFKKGNKTKKEKNSTKKDKNSK